MKIRKNVFILTDQNSIENWKLFVILKVMSQRLFQFWFETAEVSVNLKFTDIVVSINKTGSISKWKVESWTFKITQESNN